ncbi:MAG: hypothetical protein AB1568_15615 [Thermodesulfobacteriota bacterium]
MSLKRRLEQLEDAYPAGLEVVIKTDGESEEAAKERAGMAEWRGQVLFISEDDAACL